MATAFRQQPPLTREVILGVAIRLFQKHGFSGVGMRQLADFLNVKAPSLYHHFSSKEVLAQEALKHYREEQLVRLRQIDELEGLAQKLYAYTNLFCDMLSDGARPCMLLVLVRDSSSNRGGCEAELKHFAKQNVDWLESVLRQENIEPHLRTQMTERRLADMIFASLEGIMATALVSDEPTQSFRLRANDYVAFFVSTVAR